ncbi:D-alanyl-D-alanine carboxypeptidase [Candidatus Gottesmanbacteria bacterium]|nr:D-alanyl-D-alanine carboxypeptidase [Candidatus Gottesmanbacteria bacterium]
MKKKAREKIKKMQIIELVVILVFVLLLPQKNYLENKRVEAVRTSEFDKFEISKYPRKTTEEEAPEISAVSAVVLDLESGTWLYEKNPNEKLRPASITKLMTALVSLDYYKTDQVLIVKRLPPAKGESEMKLAVGDKVSVQNLLYGLLVPSGNDAAYTLADNYPGGIENFIYSMNKKAKELRMKNTHFDNPSGLDTDNHYSSARDVALLTAAALKNPLISKIVATYGITLTDATGKKFYPVKNVNQFLGYLYGADGVKTGFTELAGECLAASVSRDGHRVISVVLKSNDRFSDSAMLLEWAYRNFIWLTPNDY